LFDRDRLRLRLELGAAPADGILKLLNSLFQLGDGGPVLVWWYVAGAAEYKRGELRLRGDESVEQGAVLRVEAATQTGNLVGHDVERASFAPQDYVQ
jgi:hypothetical protein